MKTILKKTASHQGSHKKNTIASLTAVIPNPDPPPALSLTALGCFMVGLFFIDWVVEYDTTQFFCSIKTQTNNVTNFELYEEKGEIYRVK